MSFQLFLYGVGLGFAVAIPVGPIGLLCIHRTLSESRPSGYAAGLGAACADGIYGFVAGLGLTLVANFFLSQRLWLGLMGGLFLCVYGVMTFRKQPRMDAIPVRFIGLVGSFLSTFLLTLANPLNILLFTGVFAIVGVAADVVGFWADVALAAGIAVGSGMWWFSLTTFVSLFRSRFTEVTLRWANRISGSLIFLAGVVVLLNLGNPHLP
jgi:threonine/homoserine/homoserine lactone efflux protein